MYPLTVHDGLAGVRPATGNKSFFVCVGIKPGKEKMTGL